MNRMVSPGTVMAINVLFTMEGPQILYRNAYAWNVTACQPTDLWCIYSLWWWKVRITCASGTTSTPGPWLKYATVTGIYHHVEIWMWTRAELRTFRQQFTWKITDTEVLEVIQKMLSYYETDNHLILLYIPLYVGILWHLLSERE